MTTKLQNKLMAMCLIFGTVATISCKKNLQSDNSLSPETSTIPRAIGDFVGFTTSITKPYTKALAEDNLRR